MAKAPLVRLLDNAVKALVKAESDSACAMAAGMTARTQHNLARRVLYYRQRYDARLTTLNEVLNRLVPDNPRSR